MLRVIVLFLIQINKTMKQINKVVLGAMLFPLAVFAQQMDYSKAIPFDSTVKGKTKWQPILHQEKCQTRKKVDLRLVVNAGSILVTTNKDWRILWSTCVLMEPNVFQKPIGRLFTKYWFKLDSI
jgi:hypothetical protein